MASKGTREKAGVAILMAGGPTVADFPTVVQEALDHAGA
jgi:hypothetical protein